MFVQTDFRRFGAQIQFDFADRNKLFGRLKVRGTVTEKTRGRYGLGKNDADGHEDGAAARGERNSDLRTASFGVLIAAAERNAAFGKILANCHFFLKTTAANTGEDAGLNASAIAAREHTFVFIDTR